MWLLTVEDEEGSSTYHRLSRDRYEVGRATDNDVVLAQLDVSRRHARFERDGDRWLVVDEGSRTHTYVNGCEIREPTPVGVGDVVQLGAYRLTLSNDHLTGALTPPPRAMTPARLRVIAGPSAGTEYVFRRNDFVTIGSDDGCSLRIMHKAVSAWHAVVRALPGELYELEGEGGPVFVNGHQLLGSHLLEGGDAINVAGVALVRYLEPSQVPDPRFDRVLGEHVPLPALDAAPGLRPEGATSAVEPDVERGVSRFEAVGPVPLPAPGVVPASYRVLRETTMPAKRAREGVAVVAPLGPGVAGPHDVGWRQGAAVHFGALPADRQPGGAGEGKAEGPPAPVFAAPPPGLASTARAPNGGLAEAAGPLPAPAEGDEGAERGRAEADTTGGLTTRRRRGVFGTTASLVAVVVAIGAAVGALAAWSTGRRGRPAPPRPPSVTVEAAAAPTKAAPEGRQLAAGPTVEPRPLGSVSAPGTSARGVATLSAAAPGGSRVRSRREGGERSHLEARARGGRASRAELERLLSLCQLEGDARCLALAHEQAQRAQASAP
ncbi:MAG TPA: FHA domain-containing protein [Polyangiaceae bacterium]|nr:FHA domain-containing protein [Polyangiaceae bacterium]